MFLVELQTAPAIKHPQRVWAQSPTAALLQSVKAPPTDSPTSLHSAMFLISFPLGHFVKPSGYLLSGGFNDRGEALKPKPPRRAER